MLNDKVLQEMKNTKAYTTSEVKVQGGAIGSLSTIWGQPIHLDYYQSYVS